MEYLYIVVTVTLLYNLEDWLYFHYGTAQLDLTLLALSMCCEIEKCFNLKAEAFI